MDGNQGQLSLLRGTAARRRMSPWGAGSIVFVLAYLALTFFVAQSSLTIQSLALVAAVFAILAISLDLVAGMLGLYSLGQGGFFSIGAYLTTIVATNVEVSVFWLLPAVLIVSGLIGALIGAMSLRVSGLYFAIVAHCLRAMPR